MVGTKWVGIGLALVVGTLGVWVTESPAPPGAQGTSVSRSGMASSKGLAARSPAEPSRPLHIREPLAPSERAIGALSARIAPESAPSHQNLQAEAGRSFDGVKEGSSDVATEPIWPSARPSAGPALSVAGDTLEKALSCPSSFRHIHDPILLVHGVTQTAEETWSWNYAKVLPSEGFDVCMVALPDFARGDIQVQTEYAVHAIMAVARRAGSKVDVIAYSFGASGARAAMKWWPDARALVDDLVLVSGTNHGTVHTEEHCAAQCIPSFWQMKPGSSFLAALNAGDETPGDVSYTSVYSRTDFAVQPEFPGNATSDLAGASNIAIQDVCPGRLVDHPQAVSDAAFYAVVTDALTHAGPADPARIDRSVCRQVVMPGVDQQQAAVYELAWYRDLTARSQENKTDKEPELAGWAVP